MIKKSFIFLLFILSITVSYATEVKIGKIFVKNNEEIPTEVILNKMSLKEGEIFSTEQMVADYVKLKNEKYIEDLKIFPQIEKGEINVVVDVKESENSIAYLKEEGIVPISELEKIDKSLIIKSIEVFGNINVSKEEIIKNIPVKIGGFFSKTKILEGQEKILKTGYFREVNPEVLKYKDGIYIKYKVLENPVITGIKVIGNTLFTQEELTKDFITKPGEIYNINNLKKDRDSLLKKYYDKGYSLANLVDMRLDENFNLTIQVSEGIVREIQFRKIVRKEDGMRRKPNDIKLRTKDFVLRREVELEVGKPFERSKFEKTASNLFRLGLFKNVTQEFKDIEGDPDGKIVVFLLDENKSATYTGSISYGSATGLLGSVSLENKNFKGNNQTAALSYEQGTSTKTYNLSFSDPWVKGTERLSYGWSIYKKNYTDTSSTDAYYVDKLGGSVSLGKGLSQKVRINGTLKYEQIEESNEDKEVQSDYDIITLTPSLTYDTRNNIYDATKGDYARISLQIGKILGSEEFAQTELELRKYTLALSEKNSMAYRLMTGVASSNIKEGLKFNVGGGSSVRGYDYGDFQGVYQLYGNIENRTKLDDNFQFVLFYDFGRAWENQTSFNQALANGEYSSSSDYVKFLHDIKHSYGFGVRIQTPLGPLRFDYGWPIGDNDVKGGQFYFNIGQMF
ncbi:MAG: outer membrane protein insertion porin family [Fusobacteriaceae bacterium]|nr:surface antigen [Fusobacteriales bacterium]MDN5303986.1 outer membrane protein insertion porin family [Fusobacteriaceae bacterium]